MKSTILHNPFRSLGTRFDTTTLKQLALEFLVIVAGILVALGVDNWRQGREEIRITNEHLADLAAEVRRNIWTLEKVRDDMLAQKPESLGLVLRFLNDADAPVPNARALLQAFARSTAAATPWLRDQDLVVNELIPAQLPVEFSQLSGYVDTMKAPVVMDDADLENALASIRARRGELLRLARNEVAVATGQWYALTRLKLNFDAVLEELARRDSSIGTEPPE